jgi:hypothetical protein
MAASYLSSSLIAILKINGDELLETNDDGAFLGIFKSFFQYIGTSDATVEGGRKKVRLTVIYLAYIDDKILNINYPYPFTEIQSSHVDSCEFFFFFFFFKHHYFFLSRWLI